MKTPLVAGWSLTKRCNLKCIHCYAASGKQGKDELTTEEAFKVADKLKEAGVTAVNFGGGECALRPDFIEICEYLNKLGMHISYTTNGTTFDRIKDHLNLFHDVGVSIDFADQERHDWFRGRKGCFQSARTALEQLVEAGVDTEIVTCITKLNCPVEELQKIHHLAQELGVDYWRLNRFRANGRGIDNQDSLALSKKDLQGVFAYLAEHIDDSVSVPEPLFRSCYGGRFFIEGDPSGYTAFRIQSNGEVSPSVFLSESGGNIKEKSLAEIMDSEVFKRIRDRKPRGKCQRCSSYDHCRGGDAGASYLAYGHFDGPDPLCWLEPEDARLEPVKKLSDKWNVHELYLCTIYVPTGGRK